MQATLPGIAFNELRDSGFAQSCPDVWKSLIAQVHTTWSPHKGISVTAELDRRGWYLVRGHLVGLTYSIKRTPYEERAKVEQELLSCLNQAICVIDKVV